MYKLLTFNRDYGDEHNIPAIAVMTLEEYNEWLKSPSGDLNMNYEAELAIHNQKIEDFNKSRTQLKSLGLYSLRKDQVPKHLLKIYEQLTAVPYHDDFYKPAKVSSFITAYLGNSGDYFSEQYNDFYLMEEFVNAGIVEVYDISDITAKELLQANISDLSLCNVFEMARFIQ